MWSARCWRGAGGQRAQVRRTEEEEVAVVVVVFVLGGVFGLKGGINEREGAGWGRRSAGQERHGPKAALLGAGEASEEVTMDVVLSRYNRVSGGGGNV